MKLFDLFPERFGRPVPWKAPRAPTMVGKYARNRVLAQLKRFGRVAGTTGPESVAIRPDGSLYSGFEDGRIVRQDASGTSQTIVTNTGGRPLGLRFHPGGDLLVSDAKRGLLRVKQGGDVQVLADRAEGLRFGFTDDLDVTRDGRHVYFTDASSKWGYGHDILDQIEHGGHGRFLCHDLETGETRVLMRDLCFCNGVTLGPDDAFVLVTETGSYRVLRYWLKGPRAGQHDLFIDRLPGFPDNIRFNGRDRFWLAIPAARNTILELLSELPTLRFLLMLWVRSLPLPISHTSMVMRLDLDGKPIDCYQDCGPDSYYFITQVLEHDGYLYCSSLHYDSLARLRIPS